MKKLLKIYLSFIFLISICFTGCGLTKIDNEKLSALSYEIIEYHYLDSTLRSIYDSYYKESNRITYNDGDYTYLFVFYGEMPTSGYSIKVKEIYDTPSNIVVDTTLVGPQKEETIAEKESFPAIVIKIKSLNKTIIFK